MKYKFFGFSLVVFVFFMLYIWLKPQKGIDAGILEGERIDSIVISKSQQNYTITSPEVIDSISALLGQAPKFRNMDRQNINTGFYDLRFYKKESKEPEDLRVLFNYYHGIVIRANDLYYQGDSLNKKIISLIGK
ncbi:hypothetical protein [Aridibaculum aurantiacum]|uniref:hypothetical protein n=1 Tax=Aridibaculum aurantiacum TaxID=2810307 RepID=UPI001A9768FD|nr:hypothetical protein [Aridibaculum aurantiacum]